MTVTVIRFEIVKLYILSIFLSICEVIVRTKISEALRVGIELVCRGGKSINAGVSQTKYVTMS